ncbi:bifunctional RNase H/acid phosphatase [Nocardia terpenica]|uniref:Bifunctional RNase H/acid phosphatase n=1 Tax=Nocardia terpenica TaxID=455432 RepID=A0A291RWS3_9NOCA|nr:bifunctional RNase H/acid phosphatase [Nocardia terpenica]ATL71708.1 bifunctional RNase H/acid phosphatase [Nocardia terpenica]
MPTRVIVEADGGSRGNPGPAGYGAVVWDADRERVLAERKEALGVATNNVAEYRGLIAGLSAAAELGAREVDVRMDSKLVVEQMTGRWKVKHTAMIPLADQARRLAAGFDRVDFEWIPRAQNSHADRLANEAMDDAPLVDEVRAADANAAASHRDSPGTRTHRSSRAEFADEGRDRTPGLVAENRGEAIESVAEHRGEATGLAAEKRGDATGLVAWERGGSFTENRGEAIEPAAERRTEAVGPGWTGATGRPTRLLLLRHGQTELSVQRRYSGRGNPPLTALGREQAARAAKYLATRGDIAAVVTSPLDRARETADAAAQALGVPVRVLDGLIETDFGAWEGLTFAEAAQRDPELHARWLSDPSVPAPGGESFDQVRERVEGVRRDIVALYPEQNVVVVSHVTPIKTLLQLALAVGPELLFRLHLDLASLSVAEFYPDGGTSVRLVNDTSYL